MEAAVGLSEYSGRRVRSPLVDLTAWHKKSALVIGPLHWLGYLSQMCDNQTLWVHKLSMTVQNLYISIYSPEFTLKGTEQYTQKFSLGGVQVGLEQPLELRRQHMVSCSFTGPHFVHTNVQVSSTWHQCQMASCLPALDCWRLQASPWNWKLALAHTVAWKERSRVLETAKDLPSEKPSLSEQCHMSWLASWWRNTPELMAQIRLISHQKVVKSSDENNNAPAMLLLKLK